MHHPNNGFDKFEEISALVKQTNFKITDPKTDFDVNAGNQDAHPFDRFLPLLERAQKLYKEEDLDNVDDEDQALVNPKLECVFPNLHDQAQMLAEAGIGFGEVTTTFLQKCMKRLAKISGATSLKFFGKIMATTKDYWVISGTLAEQEEDPKNAL